MLFWKDSCQADQQSVGRHGRTVSIIPEGKVDKFNRPVKHTDDRL